MDKNTCLEMIREILSLENRFHIDVPVYTISVDTKIIEDLAMDSIQIMDLLVEIEERFDITFDFECIDADRIASIGTIIDMIVDRRV